MAILVVCATFYAALAAVMLAGITRYALRKQFLGALSAAAQPVRQGKNLKKDVFVPLALFICFVGASCLLPFLIRRAVVPQGAAKLDLDALIAVYFPAFFLGAGCFPFVFFSSCKFFRRLEFKGVSEATIQRNANICRLVVLLVLLPVFPFYALGLNHYGYYNAEKIVYNPYFAAEAAEIDYREISGVRRYFHEDNNGKISSMHYEITGKDGETIDILFGDYIEQTAEIHRYIADKNPGVLQRGEKPELTGKVQKFLEGFSPGVQLDLMEIFGLLGDVL